MKKEEMIACYLCQQQANLKYQNHIGYQETETYDIYHCSNCETAFAAPLKVNEEIYDHIYKQIEKVPGYDRYYKYANQVLLEKDPLSYLAHEDMYWAVQEFLHKQSKKIKILEVGCGFGYLTYALAKAGYDVLGIDISQVAINEATNRYGPYFACEDIQTYAAKKGPVYDVVLFTEVIEHVPHIKDFFHAANRLLKPGGHLLVTTPNRTLYPADILWETEPPPVHLWWLSEKSMRFLADQLGHDVTFTNFAKFHLQHLKLTGNYPKPHLLIRNFQPSRLPRLDRHGDVLNNRGIIFPSQVTLTNKSYFIKKFFNKTLKTLNLLNIAKRLKKQFRQITLKRFLKKNPQPGLTLCAVFHKKLF